MAKKATKRTTKPKTAKKDCCGNSKLGHKMIIGLLTVLVICVVTVIVTQIWGLKQNALTKNQETYLEVFPVLARDFAANQDIVADQDEVVTMTGYGVSDTDGAFYIAFDFYTRDENYQPTSDVRHGKVYFWKDATRGTYSYAYSYDE